ncbi:MAG TPA: hypothetical protein VNA12_09890 [Mycobacteriales bacterium]|nr:hypothetical protein [Mycobacteriales bacterium]
MPSTPRNATDATTLAEALQRFEAEGFTGQFAARDGAQVMCFSCRTESPAGAVVLEGLIRTEGASDPDDMTAVAALVCPSCQAKGTVALHFGPSATLEEDEVLSAFDDRRGETGISAAEPPRH